MCRGQRTICTSCSLLPPFGFRALHSQCLYPLSHPAGQCTMSYQRQCSWSSSNIYCFCEDRANTLFPILLRKHIFCKSLELHIKTNIKRPWNVQNRVRLTRSRSKKCQVVRCLSFLFYPSCTSELDIKKVATQKCSQIQKKYCCVFFNFALSSQKKRERTD